MEPKLASWGPAWPQLRAGKRVLKAGKQALEAGKRELGAGKRALEAGKQALEAGKRELGVGKRALEAGKQALGAGKREAGWALEAGRLVAGRVPKLLVACSSEPHHLLALNHPFPCPFPYPS